MKANRQQTPRITPPPPLPPADDATADDRLTELLAGYTKSEHVFLEMAIGPDMAEAMLKRNFSNRPLRESKAVTMAQDMVAGLFLERQPHPVCFDFNGVLRDGQHRMRAVIVSGCTVWLTVCFGCDPKERDYYDQGTPRSVSDIAREHGQQNTTQASAAVALILRIEQETNRVFGRNEQTQRLDKLFDEDPVFDAAIKAGMKLRLVMNVAAATLAYWHIATHTAHTPRLEKFWEGIQKGSYLSDDSPVLRVRNILAAKKSTTRGREGSVKRAAAVILAWNATIERRRPRSFEWAETLRLPEVV